MAGKIQVYRRASWKSQLDLCVKNGFLLNYWLLLHIKICYKNYLRQNSIGNFHQCQILKHTVKLVMKTNEQRHSAKSQLFSSFHKRILPRELVSITESAKIRCFWQLEPRYSRRIFNLRTNCCKIRTKCEIDKWWSVKFAG